MLILSPGPGVPSKAGCLLELIGLCRGEIPMLGICLGHQALIEQYGGIVGQFDEIMHGKASLITHCQDKMFANVSHPLAVGRYHSLIGTTIPESLEIVADYNGACMSIYNHKDRVIGFQFHPESILTCEGAEILKASLELLLQTKGQ